MKENVYGGALKEKLVKHIGGQVYKISDQATLGLPDYAHVNSGFTTYIECKIGVKFTIVDKRYVVKPWKQINDIRQFEVCKRISKEALVLYAMYWPQIRMSVVISLDELLSYKPDLEMMEGDHLKAGHGIEMIAKYEEVYRYKLTGR